MLNIIPLKLHMQNGPSMWAGFPCIPIIEDADWTCIIHERNGCYCNACFSVAVPSASPCSQNRHLHALKGTSEHWRPIALDAMPRREGGREGGREEKERGRKKLQKPGAATHYCWPISLSLSVFLFLFRPLHCQSASSPFFLLASSSSPPQWVPTSQWICPGCWH